MSKENLLGIFYRGVHTEIRRALDTASYGSFASLDVDQAERLIENLAQSDASFGNDYDRSSRKQVASVDEAKSMADLKRELNEEITNKMCEKMEKMEKVMVSNAKSTPQASSGQGFYQDPSQAQGYGFWDQQGNFHGNYQEGYGQEFQANESGSYNENEEVNYVGNQGGYNNFRPFNQHPNLSYRNPNVENPQDQSYPNQPSQGQTSNQTSQNRPTFYPNQNQATNPRPPQGNFQPRPNNFNQFPNQFQGQNRPFFPNNQWNHPRGNNFQGNFQQPQQDNSSSSDSTSIVLNAIIKRLENLETQKAPPPPKQTTFFPSNPIVNPKAPPSNTLVFANEDKKLDVIDERNLEVKLDSPQVAPTRSPIELSKPPKYGSIEENNRWRMTQMAKILEAMPFREAIKTYPSFFGFAKGDNSNAKVVDEDVHVVDNKEDPKEEVEVIEYPKEEVKLVEDPPVFKNAKDEIQKSTIKANVNLGSEKSPLAKGNDMDDFYSRLEFAKAILANKEEVEKLIEEIEKPQDKLKVLEKKGSPSMFHVPCSLGKYEFDGAFCDSGSYVSVISSKLANEMELENMQPCDGLVTFGDQSSKQPKGIFKDFPVKIGDCLVPTDILVLDMVDEKNQSLLLGIPFLLTVGAKLDYVKRVVSFENIDKNTFYPLDKKFENLVGTITLGDPMFTINEGNDDAKFEPPKSKSQIKRMRRKKKKREANAKLKKEEPTKAPNPSLTFVPRMLVDGKLECKVKAKHGPIPFSKVRIILGSTSQVNEGHMMSEKMAKLFNMKLVDYGPQPPCPPPLAD